ncbi:hypothetical protein ACN38_g11614 [Penicillium nordicum]|uniref:Uncharacterized protein n=1 Tax=Penicillium nordicum TaxID=229535 RepID=A0A0M8NQY6_9EURO|nr:hypothetical protein ACN38_g11614 [Penicillium nordicum]
MHSFQFKDLAGNNLDRVSPSNVIPVGASIDSVVFTPKNPLTLSKIGHYTQLLHRPAAGQVQDNGKAIIQSI